MLKRHIRFIASPSTPKRSVYLNEPAEVNRGLVPKPNKWNVAVEGELFECDDKVNTSFVVVMNNNECEIKVDLMTEHGDHSKLVILPNQGVCDVAYITGRSISCKVIFEYEPVKV